MKRFQGSRTSKSITYIPKCLSLDPIQISQQQAIPSYLHISMSLQSVIIVDHASPSSAPLKLDLALPPYSEIVLSTGSGLHTILLVRDSPDQPPRAFQIQHLPQQPAPSLHALTFRSSVDHAPLLDITALASSLGAILLVAHSGALFRCTPCHFPRSSKTAAAAAAAAPNNEPHPLECRPIALPRPVVAVAAGNAHALILTEDGTVFQMDFGLGSHGPDDLSAPRAVLGPNLDLTEVRVAVRSIACGAAHSVAVARDGSAFAWGWCVQDDMNKYVDIDPFFYIAVFLCVLCI